MTTLAALGDNVAIVHDFLTQRGGAERVVLQLAALFPGAPVYTSIYEPSTTFPEFRTIDVRTTRLQGKVDPKHFRRSVLRYPGAFADLDLSAHDLVIVSSAAAAHHVRHPRSFVYCHSSPRYLYDIEAYGSLASKLKLASAVLAPLRYRDKKAAAHHLGYAANSAVVQARIALQYHRVAPVIYPPVSTDHLPASVQPLPCQPRALLISRLLPYKRVDTAIEACLSAGVPLTVVGEGPDRARLAGLAGTGATLLGGISDAAMADLFVSHSVLLAPGVEDFGLMPIEANYAGRPVVAIGRGGALETVVPGVNGVRVPDHDPAHWADAIREVLAADWDPAALRAGTAPFQRSAFASSISSWVNGVTAPA